MLTLDGSAGGGQLLRTALSLAALTGRGFTMEGIRARRSSPGLRPQHLAAVRLLGEVTGADVDGGSLGSTHLRFDPGPIEAGPYEVDVGTAGSLSLLFDAVLPLAGALEAPLTVAATGGTDVRWAPCIDSLRHVKLPLLRRHGLPAAVDVHRRGFYPAGGGRATLSIGPATLKPLALASLDPPSRARVYSVATSDLADREVASRQATAAADQLADLGIAVRTRRVERVEADSTGSAIVVAVDRGPSVLGGDALGEQGTPAEAVGERAVEPIAEAIEAGAAVDGYLADQLMVPLALAGGELTTAGVTDHLETNRTVLGAFGYQVDIEQSGELVRLVG